ncbi:polysaccharide deacetylase family protein [Streptomyces sp. TRM 70351]|uniref:polysaccharide deacetylase family protein n=1 Tax=Streptomyces sp. TRM 70351 TaxID=3116552 RepID=UPI002E7AFC6F|nr:polysaccharide deacetylase family protein [Streptomyces sp. TRM 70351]MEE1928647.1 polysaccharide deacetylase family protein [Streptomyces sp. TRM 70351]
MQYDPRDASRRLLLRGGAGLGVLALYRLLTGEPGPLPPGRPGAGPGPGPGSAPSGSPGRPTARADARPPAPPSYRLRPLAGHGRRGDGTDRRPVPVRTAAHETLPRPGRYVALTFDDGPHPTRTPAVLAVLRRHGVRATFFVIGENAAWHPDVLKAVAADGHVVANHSWSHPQLDLVPAARVRTELGRTCDLVDRALGAPPLLARAPYGAWDAPSLRICAELGMEPMGWSVDSLDWVTRPDTRTIRTRVLRGVHPGAIVLAHDGGDGREPTVAALAHFLPRLLDRGYLPVPLTGRQA